MRNATATNYSGQTRSPNADHGRMVKENIGLAHKAAALAMTVSVRANQSNGNRVPVYYDDVFQAACVGMLEASQRYDGKHGASWSTWVYSYALGYARREANAQSGVYRHGVAHSKTSVAKFVDIDTVPDLVDPRDTFEQADLNGITNTVEQAAYRIMSKRDADLLLRVLKTRDEFRGRRAASGMKYKRAANGQYGQVGAEFGISKQRVYQIVARQLPRLRESLGTL